MDEAGPGDSGTPSRPPGTSDRDKPTAAPPVVFPVRDGALPGRQHGRAPVLYAPEGLPLREVRRYHPHGRPAGQGARRELRGLRALRGDGGRRCPAAVGHVHGAHARRGIGAHRSQQGACVCVCPGSWRGLGGGGEREELSRLLLGFIKEKKKGNGG